MVVFDTVISESGKMIERKVRKVYTFIAMAVVDIILLGANN